MADELAANLATYKLQFQQVEAALTTDPTNEELLKLKADLQEVIDLTTDLLHAAPGKSSESTSVVTEEDEASSSSSTPERPVKDWLVGDKCQATYSQDKIYYPATVGELKEDGTATVVFDVWMNTEVVPTVKLKLPSADQGKASNEVEESKKAVSKKAILAKQREYKKKKQHKKAERLKQLDQMHETQKSNWQNFSNKASKSKKGIIKKSIFASPDSSAEGASGGRVGVGTCGTGGQPMTKFDKPTQHYQPRK
ncbi:survival of motor neuron-related-splicing factor 30-like [Amphiura filiformis]|uniref:survival of motor neuron-related-splicing factor 30-like n=1 Tax=Amphiura filiformis TaxID=82378 RepID=UPI003B2126E7